MADDTVTVANFTVLRYSSNEVLDLNSPRIFSIPLALYFILPVKIGLIPNLNPYLPKLFASLA